MLRRAIVLLPLVAALGCLSQTVAWAHAGLRLSDPPAGATLGDTPIFIALTFTEKPEAALSVIQILDTRGVAYQIGRPEKVEGKPLALAVRVRSLPRGVYTVSWRILSSVDGHVTVGAYAFGVLVSPATTALPASTHYPATSPLEVLSRWCFLLGLVAMLGASWASVARFGGTSDLNLAACGWILAACGLALMAEAQRQSAAVPLGELLRTSVGEALIGRALVLGAALGTLWMVRRSRPRVQRGAMAVLALATLLAMAIHTASGHAAANPRFPLATLAVQWAHFAATGLWLGGLAALLLAVAGAPTAAKAVAVRRFSGTAAVGLVVVAGTGLARSVQELSSWDELISTRYGCALLTKVVLMAAIAVCGFVNRKRSVPVAVTDLGPLRRTAGAELTFAAGALAAAALLGTLPPPSAERLEMLPGLAASGADFGTTVRVSLTAPSDQPGPNRFVVQVLDFDSRSPVRAERVSLRFAPLDDPGIEPTFLPLARAADGSYVGSGANLAFDGRWRVSVLIERRKDSVEVPLEIEARGLRQFLSIERNPGEPPRYTFQVMGGEFVRFSPDPERPGPNRVTITYFDVLGERREIDRIIIATSNGDGPTRQLPARRIDQGEFVVDVGLKPGQNRVTAIARTTDGIRLRAVLDLDVPER